MRNVGETTSSNPNISQISVNVARVDWFYDICDWIDTYKITWLKKKKWKCHIKHGRKQDTLIFAGFHSAISDSIFPETLNLCQVALSGLAKKQFNIHSYEASKSTVDLQNELPDMKILRDTIFQNMNNSIKSTVLLCCV